MHRERFQRRNKGENDDLMGVRFLKNGLRKGYFIFNFFNLQIFIILLYFSIRIYK